MDETKLKNKVIMIRKAGSISSAISYMKQYLKEYDNDKWVKTSERLPTKEDGDKEGYVQVYIKSSNKVREILWGYGFKTEDQINRYPNWRRIPEPPIQ